MKHGGLIVTLIGGLGLAAYLLSAGSTSAAQVGGVVINEIMYHPSSELDAHEFVELTNTGAVTADLSGWFFGDGLTYVFPEGTLLPPGGYLVVAHDPTALAARHGLDPTALFGPFAGKRLSDSGERVTLNNAQGGVVDQVTYADSSPWPIAADGQGPSLELLNPVFDNDQPCSWAASSDLGTPGAQNSAYAPDVPPCVTDVAHAPVFPRSDQPPVVTARITDNGAVVSATVYYRRDEDTTFVAAPMSDDGTGADPLAGDGVYTAQLPTFADGTLVEFYVQATDDVSMTTRVPSGAPGTTSAETGLPLTIDFLLLVEDAPPTSAHPVYRVLLSGENQTELTTRDLYSNALLDATFIYGSEVYYNVGLRYRGESSRPSNPKSYRINFPASHLFQPGGWGAVGGIKRLNLVADNISREALTHDLFRRAGLIASDTAFVNLYFNTTYQALYIAVEQVDDYFLAHHLPGDETGNLYRAKDGGDLSYRGEAPDDYRAFYLKQNNEEQDDYADVIALTDALTNSSDEEFQAAAENTADMAQWVRWFAINAVVFNTEGALFIGQGDDYYLYHRPSDDRFILIPWDHDSTFNYPNGNIWAPNLPIVQRILYYPPYTRLYYQNIASLAANEFSAAEIHPIIDALPAELDGEKAGLKQFVTDRIASLESQIPDGALSVTTNGGQSFTTTDRTVALEGTCAPLRDVYVNGSADATYPTADTWRYTARLRPQDNRFVITDRDLEGRVVTTHALTITLDAFVGGVLTQDLTLTRDAGPHVILQDIVVPSGLTLTIEPGATVAFAEGVSLFVEGGLAAEGTAASPITLTRDINTDHWGAVGIYSSTQDNRLSHVIVEYAGQASYNGHTFTGVGVYNGLLTLEDSEIRKSGGTALSLVNATATVRGSQIHDAAAGPALHAQDSRLVLQDSTLFNLMDHALVLSQTAPISGSLVRHNTIYGALGDCIRLEKAAVPVERNDLHHCTGAGLSLHLTSSLTLTNNLIHQNGTGIAVQGSAQLHLAHNTLTMNNDAGLALTDPASRATLVNSIVWETGVPITATAGATLTVTYSDVQGGWPGEGNMDADPLFRQPGAGLFRLQETSPCIDQATSAGALPIDLLGIPRPEGDGYDMGAFEFFEYYSTYLPMVVRRKGGQF